MALFHRRSEYNPDWGPKSSEQEEKSSDSVLLKDLGKYTTLDSMIEAPVVISSLMFGIVIAVATSNLLYSLGTVLIADSALGKLHNKFYHYLERKFESNHGSH